MAVLLLPPRGRRKFTLGTMCRLCMLHCLDKTLMRCPVSQDFTWIFIHTSLDTLDLSVNPVVQCRRTWYQFSRAHIPLFRSTNDGIGRPVVVQHLCICPVDKCIGSAP